MRNVTLELCRCFNHCELRGVEVCYAVAKKLFSSLSIIFPTPLLMLFPLFFVSRPKLFFRLLQVLADTFPANKFLMNGMILGVKGFLSFLSAPLVGALSDTWGRKSFLLLTVFCTCMPIPCLKISPWFAFLCSFWGLIRRQHFSIFDSWYDCSV